MPRGNTKDNRSNSPFVNPVKGTPEQLKPFTTYAMEIYKARPVDLHDYNDMDNAIREYFEMCDRTGVRPANLGLYAWLGMDKDDVSDVITGRNKSKISPDCIGLLKRAKIVMSSYRESLAIAGHINAPIAIFWAKNFDKMEDYTRLEVQPINERDAILSPEQVRAALDVDRIQEDID